MCEYVIHSYERIDYTYSKDWYIDKILLRNKNVYPNFSDSDFFDAEQMKETFAKNKNNKTTVTKTYHKFRVIKIHSKTDIEIIQDFVHPFYGEGKYQRIYLSDNLEYLFERLVNQQVLLYRKSFQNDIIVYKLIRRIHSFPMDISELTYANYLFT